MKRFLLLVFVFMLMANSPQLFAQQVEEFSLVRENAYALNPAVAGTSGFMAGNATYRKQFTQLNQSPFTAFLGAHGQFENKNFGLGGYAIYDQTGPTGKTAGHLSFAYHIRLDKGTRARYHQSDEHLLSIGLGVSIVQYRLYANELDVNDAGDPQLYTSRGWRILPDVSAGVFYKWKDHLYAGISVPQITGLNVNYNGRDGDSKIKLVQHINFLVGGKYGIKEDKFTIEPVAALRWAKGAPVQFDAGLRFGIYKWVYVGCNYRSKQKVVLEGGLRVKDFLVFSYAYDFDLAPYSQQIGGTHEGTLSFRIVRK